MTRPDPIRYMEIEAFQKLGFLQEANRLFFHPHGLALEITPGYNSDEGEWVEAHISGVWDYRDDPEGVAFGEEYLKSDVAIEKANSVAAEREKHRGERTRLFGEIIQRVPVD